MQYNNLIEKESYRYNKNTGRDGFDMATKSIIKDVVIRDMNLVKKLIVAMEQAENKGSVTVTLSKPVNMVTRDQVKTLFEEEVD